MTGLSKGIFIVGAKRTPFGTFGGTLKNHSATDLQVIANKAAIQSAAIKPEEIDHVIIGNVAQTSKDAIYLARHSALKVGIPVPVPAVTVNRLCGSGFQSVVDGCLQILAGDSNVVLAGGTESMSQAPFIVRGTRFGTTFGKPIEFEDSLWSGLTDQYIKTPMALTAEKLGDMYKISRRDVDEYALNSQLRWSLANNDGVFKREITPITIKGKKGDVKFEVDEHPRLTTIEKLSGLPPVFKKDGIVTAGNASGICDGAAACILASDSAVERLKLEPLVRIVGWHATGCDPSIMGIGPVPAIQALVKKTGVSLDKVGLIEINEAFGAQVLACQKELKIDMDKFNINGGAIALGHPLGASGNRILVHLAHNMKHKNVQYGIGSACIGGGQGIAVLLERI
uniref:3-ketoacyl-CoA thiolase, mitochondrial n=1 Tax=Parastrongyloides trichosuri TaxID=131310 RepID=A0A0N4ZAU2_PARTI